MESLTIGQKPREDRLYLGKNDEFSSFSHRPLAKLLNFAQEVFQLEQGCQTREAQKAFREWSKQQYGKKFVEKSISVWQWWSQLSTDAQQRIEQIDLSYWPISLALSLMKVGERLDDFRRVILGCWERARRAQEGH